jgi:3-hydroxyisobutyrate dehydrogenase-like beta-hydroxyacid dehydrogenase
VKTEVGLIGLGQMGRAIARRVLVADYRLKIYNRTREKAEIFLQQGAGWASCPRELAESVDVVITVVADNDALEAVVTGPDGVAAGIRPGCVLVDMSTLSPAGVQKSAAAVEERGAEMLHAPILGGPMNVYVGGATITVGGKEEVIRRIRPLLENISRPVINVGPLTNGTHMKLALNIMLSHLLSGIASSLAFAGRAELDQKLLIQIISRAAGHMLERIGEKMLSDDTGVTFSIRNLEKDQRYFLEAAGELNLKLPTIETTQRLLKKALDDGWSEEDYTGLYRLLSGNK